MLPQHPTAPQSPRRIGVGIDISCYGHYAAFLTDDLHPATDELAFAESTAGYALLYQRLEAILQRYDVRLVGVIADASVVRVRRNNLDDAYVSQANGTSAESIQAVVDELVRKFGGNLRQWPESPRVIAEAGLEPQDVTDKCLAAASLHFHQRGEQFRDAVRQANADPSSHLKVVLKGDPENAFSNLAASVSVLAGVIDLATGRLRQHLALDGNPLILPHDGGTGHTESDIAGSNGSNKRGRSKATS